MKLTKVVFNQLNVICRTSWKGIAHNGFRCKPRSLYDFDNECPACHIAYATATRFFSNSTCFFCPIEKWRKQAITKGLREELFCSQLDSPYNKWKKTDLHSIADNAALEIANEKWIYLPEYALVDVFIPTQEEE